MLKLRSLAQNGLNLLQEAVDLGFRRFLFRINYEITNRSGLRRRLHPVRPCHYTPKHCYMDVGEINRDIFNRLKREFFVPDKNDLLLSFKNGEYFDQKQVLQKAELGRKGTIECFSRWNANFGDPINWHFNPMRGIKWPNDVHWSQIMDYEPQCGDCKITWEVNRFPHIYDLVKAYIVTGDSQWVKEFARQVKLWEENNPYQGGMNWNSGQELAIRSLNWILAVSVMIDDAAISMEDIERLLRLFYLHGKHIADNIDYARMAVNNNHLIGEALALYVIGSYFPWMKGAGRWKSTGRHLLETECLKQFYNDGGYCQCSHNYHRLALQYYIWACRVSECLGEPLGEAVYSTMARSGEYLAAFMNSFDGALPNWGNNDGALLCLWNSCDFSDYRPLITTLKYLTTGKRAFDKGPWDEDLLWFFGSDALKAPVEPYQTTSLASFAKTGLHVLRQGAQDFAVFRCGSLPDRFGQADQLHVDIWWKGQNIAQDGGTFLYNDQLEYHRFFMGTKSHNTVVIDGKDQMLLYRRFKWLHRVKADIILISDNDHIPGIAGEHHGYQRLPGTVNHKRYVWSLGNGIYVIEDEISQQKQQIHHGQLHWLLSCWDVDITEETGFYSVIQHTPVGPYKLCLSVYQQQREPLQDASLQINKGKDGEVPDGWASRYYGEILPVYSVRLDCIFKHPLRFISIFGPVELEITHRIAESLFELRTAQTNYELDLINHEWRVTPSQ